MTKRIKKVNQPTHYVESVFAEIEYVVEFSQPHAFYYDETYHPGMGKMIAAHGWRAVIVAKWRGQEQRAEACLAMGQKAVEDIARMSAYYSLDLSSFNEGPYYQNEDGKLVKNPFAP